MLQRIKSFEVETKKIEIWFSQLTTHSIYLQIWCRSHTLNLGTDLNLTPLAAFFLTIIFCQALGKKRKKTARSGRFKAGLIGPLMFQSHICMSEWVINFNSLFGDNGHQDNIIHTSCRYLHGSYHGMVIPEDCHCKLLSCSSWRGGGWISWQEEWPPSCWGLYCWSDWNNENLKIADKQIPLTGNKIVHHSDVVGASPVGAAPTTSSFSA